MPRLKRVDASDPGIGRRRRGRGFEYLDEAAGGCPTPTSWDASSRSRSRRLHRQGVQDLERHRAGCRRPGRLGAWCDRVEDPRERAIRRVVGEVAHYLGNTPAVSRASYIDPRVFDGFRCGLTIAGVLPVLGDDGDLGMFHGPVEEAVLDLIAGGESEVIEQVGEFAAA